MPAKSLFAWTGVAGLVILIIGSFLTIWPYVGAIVMFAGAVIMIVSIIFLIPILIREKNDDNRKMRNEISEKELRP